MSVFPLDNSALHLPPNVANTPEWLSSSDSEGKMAYFDEGLTVAVLRWTIRIIGTALLILIAAIAIGEGVPNSLAMSVQENLLSVAFLMMTLGLLIGWKWEGIGGLLIVRWFALFAVGQEVCSSQVECENEDREA